MAHEIERKYLLHGNVWRSIPPLAVKTITQAYLKPDVPVFIGFNEDGVTLSFRPQNGQAVDIAVPSSPATADFAAVRDFPSFDKNAGRLNPDESVIFRIRTVHSDESGEAFLTIKRPTADAAVTDEYELPVPFAKAQQVQETMCQYFVSKTRHVLDVQGTVWEVDVFAGPLHGLIVAEVEVGGTGDFETMAMLPGIAEDVTNLKSISNYSLGRHGIPPLLKAKLGLGNGAAGACRL